MILLAFVMAAGTPEPVEGWTVGRQGEPPQITALRSLDNGSKLEYQVGIGTIRSFRINVPGCGSDKGFDTPKGDAAARHDVVYDTLFATLKTVAGNCGIDQDTGDALLAGFDDAYVAAEALASGRDAAAPAAPAADRTEQIAGWAVADITEDGERKLRMRRSVGEVDLEYRVMAGLDRRMTVMVGGCGSNALISLPEGDSGRLSALQGEIGTLIKDVAAQCKLAPAAQAGIKTGLDAAFATIEAWNKVNPVPGY